MISNSFLFQNLSLPSFIPSPDPVEDKKGLAHSLIFRHLIERGILDGNGSLNLNFVHLLPTLKEPQLNHLQSILTNPFTIKSNPFTIKSEEDHFEFTTSLQEIFHYLDIDTIEIVGGTVFYILGKEYIEELVLSLQIPKEFLSDDFYAEFEKPAADIDIRIPCEKNAVQYREKMCAFYATKVSAEHKSFIEKNGFTKFYTHPEYLTDQFTTISFGNRHNFSIDLIFIENLKRKNLFKHDALQLSIFDLHQTAPTLVLSSNHHSILESLILKMTRTLDALNLEEMDLMGSGMLFTYLTKGWKSCSQHFHEAVVSRFLRFKSFKRLANTLQNHFANNPLAPAVFCFNLCYALPENAKGEITNAVKAIPIVNTHEKSTQDPLQDAMLLLTSEQANVPQLFDLITACFHIFGTVLSLKRFHTENFRVSETTIHDTPHLQFTFSSIKPLHFAIKDNLEQAIRTFKQTISLVDTKTKDSLLAIFNKLNALVCFYPELDSHVHFDPQKYLAAAFDLIEMKEGFFKTLGFYLLSCCDIQEGTAKRATYLLTQFLSLVQTEESIAVRKNLFSLLLKYLTTVSELDFVNHLTDLDNFNKTIHNSEIKPDDLVKSFCQNFAKINNPSLTLLIFEIWEKRPELFNEQSTLNLAEKFVGHSPRLSLKMIQHKSVKSAKGAFKAKQIFELVLNGYLKKEILLFRDIDVLTEAALQMTPKQEECKPYLELLKILLEHDFAKGLQLYENLKSKNAIAKGFSLIALAPTEKKLELTLKLNETNPIDFSKTNSATLEERLTAFFSCISSDLNEKLLQEIILLLKKIVAIKNFSASNSLKNLLKPKLEWILKEILNDCNDIETFSIYFKMAEIFDPEIISKPDLISICCAKFESFLELDPSSENILFIQGKLNKFNRNLKNISLEELHLYKSLIKGALKNDRLGIAEEFLKKNFSCLHHRKENIDSQLELLDQLLKHFFKKQQFIDAFNLLTHLEKLFPEAKILNELYIWKEIALNLPDSKKPPILLKKAYLFLNVPKILTVAESLAESHLQYAQNAQGRTASKAKEDHFNIAFSLIESYCLTGLIEALSQTLLHLKNQLLTKLTFSSLQKMNVPVAHMLPLFKIFPSVLPEIYGELFEKYKVYVTDFEGDFLQKLDFIFYLFTGFLHYLTFKSVDPLKVYEAFVYLEKEMNHLYELDIDQQVDLGLRFLQGFCSFIKIPEINKAVWKKIDELLLYDKIQETHLNVLVSHYAHVVNFYEETELFHENVNGYAQGITLKLKEKVTIANAPNVLEPLLIANSLFTLDICSAIVLKIIEQEQQNEIWVTPEAIEDGTHFKAFVKKLISACMKQSVHAHIVKLISSPILTSKETAIFFEIYADIIFNDATTIESQEKIKYALEVYLVSLRNPAESPELHLNSLDKAARHLSALVLVHNNEQLYYSTLARFVHVFSSYMEGKSDYLDYLSLITKDLTFTPDPLDELPQPIPERCLKHMQYKFFQFLSVLTIVIAKEISKEQIVLTEQSQFLAANNITNLLALKTLYPSKKNEILGTAITFCHSTLILEPQYMELAKISIRKLFSEIVEADYFTELCPQALEHSFHMMLYLKMEVDDFGHLSDQYKALKALTVRQKATYIISFLNMVLCSLSMNSFVMFYDYYKHYETFLSKSMPKEARNFFKLFKKLFKDRFPQLLENDPITIIESLLRNRNKTFPLADQYNSLQ